MSNYCKCTPKIAYDFFCPKCWPYCVICNPHPNPVYPGDTRYICFNCEDPNVTIKGHRDVTKNIGLLKCELDGKVKGGISKSNLGKRMYYPENKYYSIQSAVDLAETLFANDPKRLKKLERYKTTWKKSIETKVSADAKKEKIFDNIKLAVQKFEWPIQNDSLRNIIWPKLAAADLDDPQLIHALISDLENYSYSMLRKDKLDKLIDTQIPSQYHSIVKAQEYNDYINKCYHNDDHLTEIFTHLYQIYKLKMEQDNRESALSAYINSIVNNPMLASIILNFAEFKTIFNDYVLHNKGQFDDVCKKICEMATPIIQKHQQALKIKYELLDMGIMMNITLSGASSATIDVDNSSVNRILLDTLS